MRREAQGRNERGVAVSLRPDLVVLEVELPDGDGLGLIRRARDEPAKVLVLSAQDETLYAERCLQAGASGYVGKEEATGKVIDAIAQVLAGKVYLSPAMTERLLPRAAGRGKVDAWTTGERLSGRDLTVFQMIGRGLATREIAGRLHLSVKTVQTYRRHIKVKLGLRNSRELCRVAAQWVVQETTRAEAELSVR